MSYKPTGYKPGRPRMGEMRPSNPNAEACKRYYHDRCDRDPFYKAQLAEKALNWRNENPERAREIERGVARRKREWDKAIAAEIESQVIGTDDDIIVIEAFSDLDG